MKRSILFFSLMLLTAGANAACFTAECVAARKAATVEPVPVATADEPLPAPDVPSLLQRLTTDAKGAIARASDLIATLSVTPESAAAHADQIVYAKARVACYSAILEIAPNISIFNLPTLHHPGAPSAGILDKFEIAAEFVEGVSDAADTVNLSPVDDAKLVVACGWIGQRGRVIGAKLGFRIVKGAAGLAFLLPK